MTNYTNEKYNTLAHELGLSTKEVAAFMARSKTCNYDEWLSGNMEEFELSAEELEEVIAPGIRLSNHNETLVSEEIELEAEDLEEIIAPKLSLNYNTTLVSDEIKLEAEDLEEVIAPGTSYQHNETLVSD